MGASAGVGEWGWESVAWAGVSHMRGCVVVAVHSTPQVLALLGHGGDTHLYLASMHPKTLRHPRDTPPPHAFSCRRRWG